MSAKSLYQRLGGKQAIEAAVDLFYTKVISDNSIKRFFKDADMASLKRMQMQFLTYAFGGSKNYNGKSLAKAHSHLVDQGLNDNHFDAVIKHLGATLKELGVSSDLIKEAAGIAESVRDDVLNRSGNNSDKGSSSFRSAIEGSATAIMMVDRDLVVTYVNDATTNMIRENLHEFTTKYPGFNLDDLLGTCIDIFHKNPAHQRKILSDPANLPYKADIKVGNLSFALNVSAMIDANGNYIGNTLEWANVTEERRFANEAARIQSAVDGSATAIMMVDRDLVVTYVNTATKNMIKENLHEFTAKYPGFNLDDLVGTCIDIFHKNPAHQRKILSDPTNLPYKADIKVGNLSFALNVSAMIDAEGSYIGNTLEWSNVTGARKQANEAARIQSAVDGSATAIMMVDRDLVITYVNNATKIMIEENLQDFEAKYPGFRLDKLVGTCIDTFHKNPAHQRKILSDPANLPYQADIAIGNLNFSLNVSAMIDADGNYIGNTLEWSDVTETRKQANEAARSKSSIDGSSTPMIMIDRDLVVTYMNDATRALFKEKIDEFKKAFPGFTVEGLLGTCIDVFHKNPAHQRKILNDPSNLPYKADINVAGLTIALNVSAMFDRDGVYIGNTLEWVDVTESRRSEKIIADTIEQILQLDGQIVELGNITNTMVDKSNEVTKQMQDISKETNNAASGAEEMSNTMTEISSASEQAAANINSVAISTEEMTNSVAEIANNAEKAREVTQSAVQNVGNASESVKELDLAAKEISQVIEVIVEIAEQTKLLALNATIEAARAGEAGKGFAVVANEVKELAKQTREATVDIRKKIENMQSSTDSTVGEIGTIEKVINDVNEIVTIIATSVEEQNVTTKDIAGNISQATVGVVDVTKSVVEAAKVAKEISSSLNNINGGTEEVGTANATLVAAITTVKETSIALQEMVNKLRQVSAKTA